MAPFKRDPDLDMKTARNHFPTFLFSELLLIHGQECIFNSDAQTRSVCRFRREYLRGFADVHVGLLLAFAELPQLEDGQLVLLLVRLGLQFLRTGMRNRRSKQNTTVNFAAACVYLWRTWTRSKTSACSLSVSWERYFWMAIFALGG